jgi:hypothetical protein
VARFVAGAPASVEMPAAFADAGLTTATAKSQEQK